MCRSKLLGVSQNRLLLAEEVSYGKVQLTEKEGSAVSQPVAKPLALPRPEAPDVACQTFGLPGFNYLIGSVYV